MIEYRPEDYVKYRIGRAKETIQEVRTHIENKYWNTAINRMYYACFYAVSALLAKDRIDVSSHSGFARNLGNTLLKRVKLIGI